MKERVNLHLATDKEEDKNEDWEMITNNFSKSEGNFDVTCNMVSVLLVEYDVVTEVNDA